MYARTAYLIFARRTPGNADLIAANEVTQKTLDLQAFIDDCRWADPDPASGLKAGAMALQDLGWYEQAEKVWQECLDCRDDMFQPWVNKGLCFGMQGIARQDAGDLLAAQDYYRRAQVCFEKSMAYDDSTYQVWLSLGLSLEQQGLFKLTLGDRPAGLKLLRRAEDCFQKGRQRGTIYDKPTLSANIQKVQLEIAQAEHQ